MAKAIKPIRILKKRRKKFIRHQSDRFLRVKVCDERRVLKRCEVVCVVVAEAF